jgi:hypothetical protein
VTPPIARTPSNPFEALQSRAAQQGSNVQAVILQVIENALGTSPNPAKNSERVQLPLLLSKHPGALRSMTGAEIDDILG